MAPISSRPLASTAVDQISHGPPEELLSRAPTAAPQGAHEAPIPFEREPRNVLLCHRPVTFLPAPLAKAIASAGGDHQWLEVGAREVGMGRDDGSVPIDSPDHPGIPSRLVDHKGQASAPGVSCEVIANVDPECVDRSLTLGAPTDRWWPTLNDCHTVSQEILISCERARELTSKEERESGAGRP